jgi:hypothetical protein
VQAAIDAFNCSATPATLNVPGLQVVGTAGHKVTVLDLVPDVSKAALVGDNNTANNLALRLKAVR